MFGEEPDGIPTGGAAPVGVQTHWDKNGRVYQTDKNGNRLPSTVNPLTNLGNKVKAAGSNFSDWINETNTNHPYYKQKTDLLLAAATLPFAPEFAITKAAATKLAPNVGRKIAQGVSKGVSSGTISGALEGGLRSYQEKKNPVKTVLEDSAAGAVTGGAFGLAGGHIQKAIRGNKLKNIEDLKSLRKAETSYYKDYNQGKPTSHPELGQINMTQSGLETVSKQPQAGRNFSTLHKDIKNSDYIGYEKPIHKKHGSKDNIKGFHKLRNSNQEFLIADADDGLKYYMSKNIGEPDVRPSRVESNSPNFIIPNIPQKLNSWEEWLKDLRRRRGH